MKLKLFLGAIALYLVAMAVVTGLRMKWDTASVALRRKVAELGEQHAPLPSEGMQPLEKACSGKLTPGGPRSIAVYVAKLAPYLMPSLQEDYWHVDQTVLGVHEVFRLDLSDDYLKEIPEPSLPRFQEVVDPTSWSNRLHWSRAGNPELNELKYLVVARYDSLSMPVVADTTFEAGKGTFGARVLAFPSGEVLCEGRGEVSMKGHISGSGRGNSKELAQLEASESVRHLVPFVFTKAVVASPLHRLCDTGGKALCALTAEWAGP